MSIPGAESRGLESPLTLGVPDVGDLFIPNDFDLYSTIPSIFGSASWLDFGVPEPPLLDSPGSIPLLQSTSSGPERAIHFMADEVLHEDPPMHDSDPIFSTLSESRIMSTVDTVLSPAVPTATVIRDISAKDHDWLFEMCMGHHSLILNAASYFKANWE